MKSQNGHKSFNMQEMIERMISAARISAAMTEREEEVIRRRFGLNDHTQETLESIANEYGVSRSMVKQLETSALRKLSLVMFKEEFQTFKSLFEDLDYYLLAREVFALFRGKRPMED